MNSRIRRILKGIPIETRLNVVNELLLLTCLIDMGFIPNGFWSDKKEKKYGRFRKFAKKLTKTQLREFEEWEKDGRPTRQQSTKK